MNPRLRGTLLCALALCLVLPAAAPAGKRLPVRATVAECDLSQSPASSMAAFEGRMRALPGTARMSMRFTLFERFAGGRFVRVKVPELATWRTAKAGVRVFAYTQRVRALQLGGQYRMRVRFRWHDANGGLLRSGRRRSPACGRVGPLPQLQIAAVRTRPGHSAGTAEYQVDVTNAGDADATEVPVLMVVDGAALDLRHIHLLEPRETATVRFYGPPCAHAVRAEVDPEDAIRESDELDNRRRLRCAALGGGGLFG